MADSRIPYLNPVVYHSLHPVNIPQYLSKSLEKYPFEERIEEWEQGFYYPQLWQTSDLIVQQVTSAVGPVNFKVYDAEGNLKHNSNFVQKLKNKRNTAEWIYEHQFDPSSVNLKGYYFFHLSFGTTSPTILVSEPQYICDEIPNSVYLAYRNRTYYGDVLFETGLTFYRRFLAKVKYDSPGSADTIYFDQPQNTTLISSFPFDVYKFSVGGSWGIPDYDIKRLNRMFGCSYKTIDGIQYEKNAEGAKWEEKSFDGYVLSGWTIQLRETLGGKASQVYENDALQQSRKALS